MSYEILPVHCYEIHVQNTCVGNLNGVGIGDESAYVIITGADFPGLAEAGLRRFVHPDRGSVSWQSHCATYADARRIAEHAARLIDEAQS